MDNKEIVRIKTREMYHLLLVKNVNIVFAQRLLCRVYNVAWYRFVLKTSKTPEEESLARLSLEDARSVLDSFLNSWDICTLDKALIRYVAYHYEFDLG